MEERNLGTPVASFDLDSGEMLINKSIDNLILPQEDPFDNIIVDKKTITQDDPLEIEIEEEEDDNLEPKKVEDKKVEVDTLDKTVAPELEDEYDDYSESAMYGLALKEVNPDVFGDLELDKDTNPSMLVEKLTTLISSKLEQEKEVLNNKYESAAKYLEYIINSDGKFDANLVKQGMQYKAIADIELNDEVSDEDLEIIVRQGLYAKGIDNEEDVNDLVTKYKDTGKLYDRAEESIKLHKDLDKKLAEKLIQEDKERKKQDQVRFEDEKKLIEKTIAKGEVSGVKIKNTKQFMDALYKPTEIVEQTTPEGTKTKVRVPLFAVKQKMIMEDVEKRLAYVQLILNDFNFENIEKEAEKKVNQTILDKLNNKNRTKSTPSSSVANGWLI